MNLDVARLAWHRSRRGVIGWTIGLLALVGALIPMYKTMAQVGGMKIQMLSAASQTLVRAFLGSNTDLTTATGFLNAQLFFLMLPVLLTVQAVVAGSGAIAGEEERGRLDLLLAAPVRRARVAVEKWLVLVAGTVVSGLVTLLSIWLCARAVGLNIAAGRLLAATASLTLLGLALGSVAFAVGAATGRRGWAGGAAGVLAVASYLLNSLGPIVSWLEPYRQLSPFYWYIGADPLVNGLNAGHALLLLALSALALLAALLTFARRDIGT